jgi:hypothetical protein
VRESVDSHLHAVPGPADQRHLLEGELAAKRLEITGGAIERHARKVAAVRTAAAARVVIDDASVARGQRVEVR